jgi:hypothetical protein
MQLTTIYNILAILAISVLLVGVVIFRPAMLIYVVGVFAPAGAVAMLESGGSRFLSLGCATMTFAAAGPVMLAGLLDPTRNPVGEASAWIVPILCAGFGLAVAFVSPLIAQILQARGQVDNFTQLQTRQDELRAVWGETLDEPLQRG